MAISKEVQLRDLKFLLSKGERIPTLYFFVAVGFIYLSSYLHIIHQEKITMLLFVIFLGFSILWMAYVRKIFFPLPLAIFTIIGCTYLLLSYFEFVFIDTPWMNFYDSSAIPRQASYVIVFPICIIVFRSIWLGVLTSGKMNMYMGLLFILGILNWFISNVTNEATWTGVIMTLIGTANKEFLFVLAASYFFFKRKYFNFYVGSFLFAVFYIVVVGAVVQELFSTTLYYTTREWGFGFGFLKSGTGWVLMVLLGTMYLLFPKRLLAHVTSAAVICFFIATFICIYFAYDLVAIVDNMEVSALDSQSKALFSTDMGHDLKFGAIRTLDEVILEKNMFRIPWEYMLDYNFIMRAQFMGDALSGFLHSYGIGVGFGNEATMAQSYGGSPLDRQLAPLAEWTSYNHVLNSHHNDFYTMFYRLGFLGGIGFLWFVCIYCFPKFKSRMLTSVEIDRQCYLLYLLVFLTLSIHVVTQSAAYVLGLTFVLGYILAWKRISSLSNSKKTFDE